MSEEILEQYEDKIEQVADSIASLDFEFIKDKEDFRKEFKDVVQTGLQNSSFRFLVQTLLDASGEDIELKNPKEFITFLEGYLKDTGYYMPVDSFIKGGKVELNDLRRNVEFFEFLVSEVQMARIMHIAPHFSHYKEAHDILNHVGQTVDVQILPLPFKENTKEEGKKEGDDDDDDENVDNELLFPLCRCVDELSRELLKLMYAGIYETVFDKLNVSDKPIVPSISEDVMKIVSSVNNIFISDYGLRNRMLVTRARATFQAMQWSEKVKNDEQFQRLLSSYSQSLGSRLVVLSSSSTPSPSPSSSSSSLSSSSFDPSSSEDVVCDLSLLSSISLRDLSPHILPSSVTSPFRSFLIGRVPDRGGRTEDVKRIDWHAAKHDLPVNNTNSTRGGRGGRGGGRGGGFGRGRGGGGREYRDNNNNNNNNRGYQSYSSQQDTLPMAFQSSYVTTIPTTYYTTAAVIQPVQVNNNNYNNNNNNNNNGGRGGGGWRGGDNYSYSSRDSNNYPTADNYPGRGGFRGRGKKWGGWRGGRGRRGGGGGGGWGDQMGFQQY